jgi:hypothetical protein
MHVSDKGGMRKVRSSQAITGTHGEGGWWGSFSTFATEFSTFITQIYDFEHNFLQRRLFYKFEDAIDRA